MRRCCSLWLVLVFCSVASGESPRVLPADQLPEDARLGELKTLNGHFPFVVPDSAAAWHQRAEALKRRVLVATGLWPMPDKTPLEPVIHGKVVRDGFTVERVYFQSLPGHYVTGLLFRPSEKPATTRPGVLCPHGHGGRLQRHSDAEIARQIEVGGEHFSASGRMPKLARCAQLARMGCVSFIFDMLGYADSVQISHPVAHRHKDPRAEETDAKQDGWVLYSLDADLRLQSVMGLQTWNAIRALDFLAGLPDVDADRLAVTGGSGGGTQSILLGAIDDRIKVSFPNGMVSTSMQGGCYCENCNYLRVGTGNVELAALFAPNPQAMTAADDWTRDMMNDGYPELQFIYAMLGDQGDVYCRPMLNFKHNYNYVTRATMYQWMNRHLGLGLDDPVIEQDFEPLSEHETSVWTDEHPALGKSGPEHERDVCRWLDRQAVAKLAQLTPRDGASLAKFRGVFGGGWQVLFDLGLPPVDQLKYVAVGTIDLGDVQVERGRLRVVERNIELPLLTIGKRGQRGDGKFVVWTDARGKDAAFTADGQPTGLLKRIVAQGATVLIADLLGQGEFNASADVLNLQRLVNDERTYSAFTFGYNRTLAAQRCGDLLAVVAYANTLGGDSVRLLGTDGSAGWAAPAAVVAGDRLAQAVIESNGQRYADVDSYRDANFVPGAAKYGDLPVLMALRAPHPLVMVGEAMVPEVVKSTYAAANSSSALAHLPSARASDELVAGLLR